MVSILSLINSALVKIERVCCFFGGIALIVMMTIITLDALFRYFLDSPIPGVMEVTSYYLSVTMVFLALSYSYKMGAHVKVEMLVNKFPQSVRHMLNIVFGLVGSILFVAIAISGLETGLVAFSEGSVPGGVVETPIWPGYVVVAIGCLLLAIRLFLHAFVLILRRFDSDFIPEERHPAVQDS